MSENEIFNFDDRMDVKKDHYATQLHGFHWIRFNSIRHNIKKKSCLFYVAKRHEVRKSLICYLHMRIPKNIDRTIKILSCVNAENRTFLNVSREHTMPP